MIVDLEFTASAQVTSRFLRRLRIAVLLISGTILLSMSMLRNVSVYRPLWLHLTAYGVLLMIVLIEAVLVFRHRTWGNARWLGLAATVSASLASCVSLPPGYATTSADWAFGAVGWISVILFLDRSMWELVAFLALHEVITAANLLVSVGTDTATLLNFTVGSIWTIGFPLAGGVTATALRRAAKQAAEATAEAERIIEAEIGATERHTLIQQRFAEHSESTLPLLRGFIDGSLDPEDPAVQRACSIEAARMRRLFAESDMVPNQLVHELRHCAKVAERRGIVVTLDARGEQPDPPLEIRRALTEAPLAALTTAVSEAMVTVVATDELVAVSVISDCGSIDIPHIVSPQVRLQTITQGNKLWVETQWSPHD